MPAKAKTFKLEKSLDELETLVEELEAGDLELEASLKLFEKGVTLTKQCQSALKDAEQKVQKLTMQNGQSILTDYDEE